MSASAVKKSAWRVMPRRGEPCTKLCRQYHSSRQRTQLQHSTPSLSLHLCQYLGRETSAAEPPSQCAHCTALPCSSTLRSQDSTLKTPIAKGALQHALRAARRLVGRPGDPALDTRRSSEAPEPGAPKKKSETPNKPDLPPRVLPRARPSSSMAPKMYSRWVHPAAH